MEIKQNKQVKRYKHDANYPYTLGMALTIELVSSGRSLVRGIYVHPDYTVKNQTQDIFDTCGKAGVPCEINRKIFNSLSTKDNVYVIGVFDKADAPVEANRPHTVLVNPGGAGNLGTIIRTGLGFGFKDYVIIRPGVDIFDPKIIHASMGDFFHVRFSYFDSFETYRQSFPQYTDIVDIHAGRKTLFIRLWAGVFYRRRQRRWMELLRPNNDG
jgi:TrmH family RNA methyltransferase